MCSRAAHTAARATGESPEQPDAIGAAGSDNNLPDALPADALDDRIAIVGTAGSGKTYAAKGFVERLFHRMIAVTRRFRPEARCCVGAVADFAEAMDEDSRARLHRPARYTP
jgi:hypothetical protein